MTVLGLLSILRLPASSLPQSVVSTIPDIISTAVSLTIKMKEELEAGNKDDDDGAIEAEADDDDDWGGYDEDEDVTNPDDEAYMTALNKLSQGGDIASFLLGDGWDGLDEDDDEEFHSPLDNVDEMNFVNDILKEAYKREPDVYQQIQGALPAETVSSCKQIFASVDSQRNK